eukprot:8319572-Pyramimonas_sp.AAC.1
MKSQTAAVHRLATRLAKKRANDKARMLPAVTRRLGGSQTPIGRGPCRGSTRTAGGDISIYASAPLMTPLLLEDAQRNGGGSALSFGYRVALCCVGWSQSVALRIGALRVGCCVGDGA